MTNDVIVKVASVCTGETGGGPLLMVNACFDVVICPNSLVAWSMHHLKYEWLNTVRLIF